MLKFFAGLICGVCLSALAADGIASESGLDLNGVTLRELKAIAPTEIYFMAIHATDRDKDGKEVSANEKYFLGDLPKEGQAVEMVYVGSDESGFMRFQLRVRMAP